MFLIDELFFSNETELNSISQFSVSSTEGKRFHDAKELFDSAYALRKHSKHQFRHLMLCLKWQIMQLIITNHVNHCMILFSYHYPRHQKNQKELYLKKTKRCLDCKLHLHLEIDDHRSSSIKCPMNYKNWRFHSWDCWKKYLTNNYSNIDDHYSLHLKIKISMTAKECKKRDINDLFIFYSVHKDTLHLVRQACYVLLLIKFFTYFTKAFCCLY